MTNLKINENLFSDFRETFIKNLFMDYTKV